MHSERQNGYNSRQLLIDSLHRQIETLLSEGPKVHRLSQSAITRYGVLAVVLDRSEADNSSNARFYLSPPEGAVYNVVTFSTTDGDRLAVVHKVIYPSDDEQRMLDGFAEAESTWTQVQELIVEPSKLNTVDDELIKVEIHSQIRRKIIYPENRDDAQEVIYELLVERNRRARAVLGTGEMLDTYINNWKSWIMAAEYREQTLSNMNRRVENIDLKNDDMSDVTDDLLRNTLNALDYIQSPSE